MFDLEAQGNDVIVVGFDLYLYFAASNTKIEVYVTNESDSSFVGKERNPSKWSKVFEKMLSWSVRSITEINLDVPIRIKANCVQGIYITIDKSTNYELVVSPGLSVGTIIDSTDHLKIKEGTWNSHPFGTYYSTYRFLGKANYMLDSYICPIKTILNRTYYLEASGICWQLQLFIGGTLEGHSNYSSCSENAFQSSGIYSIFQGFNEETNTAIFIDGPKAYSGTFQFTKSSSVTKPQVKLRNWNRIEQEYIVEVLLPSCT